MSNSHKNQAEILDKLGIKALNTMQEEAHTAIKENAEVILLSPTGTGKTLAFLLPIISELNPNSNKVQVLIMAPSRELAIQIEQVTRSMGSGHKVNAVYGGRSGQKDKIDLKHPPAILVGTPGRVADHMRRQTIDVRNVKTLVLDEFDKSLEVGFEKEMREIVQAIPSLRKKVLTSATQRIEIPEFIGIKNPKQLNFLAETTSQLKVKTIVSPSNNKMETLANLLTQIGDGNGIVFCNLKESIRLVSDYLEQKGIRHACFYGGMEQLDREHALIKFRNKTQRLLIATDLAARGIDVPEINFIVHFELPSKKEDFTHRNGRTARMHSDGTAYIISSKNDVLPLFVENAPIETLGPEKKPAKHFWQTLYISAGRKDKVSKGDIAGLFFKQGGLDKNQLGIIELKQDCAYVSVAANVVGETVQKLNNSRLKKVKVRISVLD